MKGDTWYLKLNGEIQAKFIQTDDDMDGECYVAVGWNAMGEKPYPPCEWEFFADVCIKSDGCGHWYFRGEDYYDGAEDSGDSYYHICRDHCFLSHIRMMCFIWKLATIVLTEYYENRQPNPYMSTREAIKYMMEDFFGNEELEDLVESILNGYVIEKGERQCEKSSDY